jgi:hypothetical protein
MCRLSWNPGASTSWNSVMGLLLHIIARRQNPKVGTRKCCVDMHIRVSGVPETHCSVFRRFLVTRFNTTVLTVCGWFQRIGMRPRGWRCGFPHSQLGHALSFTDVNGMRLACDNLTVLCPKEMFYLINNKLSCVVCFLYYCMFYCWQMGGVCSAYGGIQGVGGETWRKETTWKIQT